MNMSLIVFAHADQRAFKTAYRLRRIEFSSRASLFAQSDNFADLLDPTSDAYRTILGPSDVEQMCSERLARAINYAINKRSCHEDRFGMSPQRRRTFLQRRLTA